MRKSVLLTLFILFSQADVLASSAKGKQEFSQLFTISGPDSASALTEKTQLSIYEHIGQVLGVSRGEFGYSQAEIVSKLQPMFGDYTVTCLLKLRPSGQLEELTILHSSGDQQADARAVKLLRKASPFVPYRYPDKLTWFVAFPSCKISNSWLLKPPTE